MHTSSDTISHISSTLNLIVSFIIPHHSLNQQFVHQQHDVERNRKRCKLGACERKSNAKTN